MAEVSTIYSCAAIFKAINDVFFPYFVHSSDSTTIVLVPPNGDNYPQWSRSMGFAFNANKNFHFVDESLKKPTDLIATQLLSRCSNMVLTWLLYSIDLSISNIDPHEFWQDL